MNEVTAYSRRAKDLSVTRNRVAFNRWQVIMLLIMALILGSDAGLHGGELDFFVEAVRKNRSATVRDLIQQGVDVNSRDAFGDNTGLHWAAIQGLAEMARMLIDNGADVDIRNSAGETPLHWAAKEGQKELVVILIVHGANVNARSKGSWTPLRWAEAHGYKEIARILMAAGGRR
jgi:ankyrin repeat protein